MLIWDAHIFLQFMQFSVVHFGLAHSGCRPFIYSAFVYNDMCIWNTLCIEDSCSPAILTVLFAGSVGKVYQDVDGRGI